MNEKQATLERILKAVSKDPELEYLLWERMHHLGFYGPWVPSGLINEQVVLSTSGAIRGRVEQAGNCWSWAVPDGGGDDVWTEAEAKEKVETELRESGWLPAPEGHWKDPVRTIEPPAISSWYLEVSAGSWFRGYSNGATAASVGSESSQSSIAWATWTDGVYGSVKLLGTGSCATFEDAKHLADRDLVARRLLRPDQALPDPAKASELVLRDFFDGSY